jgi:TatD DNase family protein
MTFWIDTHCHLDAAEFRSDRMAVRRAAADNKVAICVVPAVEVANFEGVRELAHATGDAYALGIHPLYVAQASNSDLALLEQQLQRWRDDPRLVAVGEIGLDFFVPALCQSPLRERQEYFYLQQLRLARKYDLPVLLHVRRSVDQVLRGLRLVTRETKPTLGAMPNWRGIAHAFNGSEQQASQFVGLGLKLGFGGALTYERALQLRRLAASLPLHAIVMETDSPDMPPHWLYQSVQQREAGKLQGRNQPAELPRIGAELAALRGMAVEQLAEITTRNAVEALPGLRGLLP